MLITKPADIRVSEVTPQSWYVRRREFLQVAGSTAVAVATGAAGPIFGGTSTALAQNPAAQKLENLKKSPLSTDEKLNSYRDVTSYNNFYEFGLDKGDPARYSGSLKPRPWSVVVEGECKPSTTSKTS
jgi:sulfoxide reductase catalytic subunit YedY